MSRSYRWRLCLLLLAAAVLLLSGIGLREPWPADEPRFALIAKDMVETGQWLFPKVGGVLYPDKPPLFFWSVAALYALTGSIDVALLLPGVIAGLGVLVLVSDLARRLWGEETAIYCGATLLVMAQFASQMKTGQIDALLCLLTTLGLYGLVRHLLLGPNWTWLAVSGAAAGLGVITKGVGFLPLLLLIPWAVARRASWPLPRIPLGDLRWLLLPAGLAGAIAIWLVPMLLAVAHSGDPALLQYRDNILFHQTMTRYADAWAHVHPPWYLLTHAAPWLWMPVTLFLPWLLPAWRKDVAERNAAVVLLGAWVLAVLLFFSLSEGKRSLYIFPAAPAVALVAGAHVRAILERPSARRTLYGAAAALAGALMLASAWALWNPGMVSPESLEPGQVERLAAIVLAASAAALLAVLYWRPARAHLAWASVLGIVWLAVTLFVYPVIDKSRSGAAIVDNARARLAPAQTLAFSGWPEQFLLQWDRPAVHFGYRRNPGNEIGDAVTWLSRGINRQLLLPDRQLNDCFAAEKLVPMGHAHRRDWYLADRSALTDACRLGAGTIERIVFYRSGHALAAAVRSEPDFIYRHATVSGGS